MTGSQPYYYKLIKHIVLTVWQNDNNSVVKKLLNLSLDSEFKIKDLRSNIAIAIFFLLLKLI